MFMFPEPPPIGYYLDDVSPSFSADGILLQFFPGPTHKCIAKHRRPIKRTPSDPLAPVQQLDPRALQEDTDTQGDGYVGRVTHVGTAIHDALKSMPKSKISMGRDATVYSTFPRSKQYDAWLERNREKDVNASGPKKDTKSSDESQDVKKQTGETTANAKCEDATDEMNCKSATAEGKNASDSVQDKNAPKEEEAIGEIKCRADPDKDKRWQALHLSFSAIQDSRTREEQLRQITKPFSHELNTWYSTNKPARPLKTLRSQGKRPLLQWRFSHL